MEHGLGHWDPLIDEHETLDFLEEFELVKRRDNGDPEAVNLLVYHNLRFVYREVEKLRPKPEDKHDLFAAGVEGLRTAAERFKPRLAKNCKRPSKLLNFAYLYVNDKIKKRAAKLWRNNVELDRKTAAGDSEIGEFLTRTEAPSTTRLELAGLLEKLTDSERELVVSRLLRDEGESDSALAGRLGIDSGEVPSLFERSAVKLLCAARGLYGGAMSSQSKDIKDTLEMLEFAGSLAGAINESLEDGKVNAFDIPNIVGPMMKAGAAFENAGDIVRELKEADTGARYEIVDKVREILDENIDDDRALEIANSWLEVAAAMIDAIKVTFDN